MNIKTFVVEKGATFKGVPKEYRLIDALKKTRKPGAKARAPEEQIKMLIADELERAYQDGIILDLPEIDQRALRHLGSEHARRSGQILVDRSQRIDTAYSLLQLHKKIFIISYAI